jgi:DNA-directed RNA polymerase I, II, and III subunit RPABC2
MSFVDDDEISISSLNSDVNEETLDKDLKEEIEVLENTQNKEPYEEESEEEEDEEKNEVISIDDEKDDNVIENNYKNEYEDNFEISEDEDEDDDDDDDYFQRLDELNKSDIVNKYHPELLINNNNEIELLSIIKRNEQGVIIDPLHRTVPFITKYERARVLGERAKQLNMGAKPLVEVGPEVIDGYLIALKEYEDKKIPFILKRPLPNGGCEYWKLKDLEII